MSRRGERGGKGEDKRKKGWEAVTATIRECCALNAFIHADGCDVLF